MEIQPGVAAQPEPFNKAQLSLFEKLSQSLEGKSYNYRSRVLQYLVQTNPSIFREAVHSSPTFDHFDKTVTTAMIQELNKVWDDLFKTCSTSDGKKISKVEREALGINRASLVYGEVSFSSFGEVIWGEFVDLKAGGVFYDIGSGTGRGVFAASLLHDFNKCVGIEILEGLYKASLDIHDKYNKMFLPNLVDGLPEKKEQELSFVHKSFLDYDWSDGDLVFANSTCFDETLMKQIANQARRLKKGAYVITLTKQLHSNDFDLLMSKQYRMSWGYATVHIHKKITGPEEPIVLEMDN